MLKIAMVNEPSVLESLKISFDRNFFIPKPSIRLSYSGALIWNSIPIDIKNATSIHSFVNKCSAWMRN